MGVPPRRGRPPAGPNGQARVAMRHQISARISPETYAQLKALAALLGISQADVITRGFDALERSLGPEEQRLLAQMKTREGR